jgi:hypothetical protein
MTFSLVDWQAITFGVHLAAYYRISRAHQRNTNADADKEI